MVFCFGELLLRMSPVLGGKWIDTNTIPVYVGGAELNAATALANWNIPVSYGTALPDNYLSHEIIDYVRSKNIQTDAIHFSGNRIGSYYLPQGADLKNAGVIYDRAFSAFWELQPGTIDWDKALEGCTWFHFSAISPALNENVAAVCEEALQAAAKKGLTISVDLNYRAKLWQYGKQPTAIMPALIAYCDVIMGNLWAAEKLAGITSPLADSIGITTEAFIAAANEGVAAFKQQYPKAKQFAYTFRLEKDYWAYYHDGNTVATSQVYNIEQITDKVGSGDCFMGGLIYGITQQHPAEEIVNFAASAAVGKLSEIGDATRQTVEVVKGRYNLSRV
jgi:2-dehydro-3-deoxygluconokinase